MVQARIVFGVASPEHARGKAGALGSGSGKGNDRGGAGKQRGADLRSRRRGGQAGDSAANARVKDLEPGYQQTSVQDWVTRCQRKCSVAFSSATPHSSNNGCFEFRPAGALMPKVRQMPNLSTAAG